ncbi:UDP-N-acetylmuramyl tripeptide synthase [Paenibacillus sp. DS2015]
MEYFEAAVVEKDDTTITVTSNDNSENNERIYTLITKGIDNNAEVGDKVKVWTTGQYKESNPIQGQATKIEVVE